MMYVMAIVLKWPDGTTTRGVNPKDVLTRIAKAQWEPVDPADLPRILSDRAWVWSGVDVDETLPPETLLQKLADAGMFKIVDWG